MDVAQQLITTSGEDGVSMYLSFDETNGSESTTSFKSLIRTSDASNESEKDDSNENTTLEPQNSDNSYDSSIKDVTDLTAALAPLHFFPSLNFNKIGQSSTPSKMQESYPVGSQKTSQETSNFSKTPEKLCKFEKNMNINKENKVQPLSVHSDDSMPSFSKKSLTILREANKQTATFPIYVQTNNVADEKTSKSATKKKAKMHTVVRKSVCEPNLLTNRPSRILANKRFSCVNNDGGALNVGNEAWKLGMISEQPIFKHETVDGAKDENMGYVKPSRKSMKTIKAANTARRSILPSVPSEICYAPPRFATVLKTTLNSSTRKVAVGASNAATSKRRSILLLQNKLAAPLPLQKKRFSRNSFVTSSDDNKSSTRVVGGGDGRVQPPRIRPVNVRKTMINEKPENKFICSECGAPCKSKALLDVHKRFHHMATVDLQNMHANSATSGNQNASTANYVCKYCDKGFAIERALHIHLLEHCFKIPASERRKLNFKEMDHVNKAETPHFRTQRKVVPAQTLYKDPLMNIPVKKYHATKTAETGTETRMQNKKKDNQIIINTKERRMAPPTTTNIKKKIAHAGIYRTPNKDIQCLPCKQAFKNIIDYTNHMMNAHKSLNSSCSSIDSRIE